MLNVKVMGHGAFKSSIAEVRSRRSEVSFSSDL
jgi:hypothetical protein